MSAAEKLVPREEPIELATHEEAPRCYSCGDLLMDGRPGVCPRCADEDRFGDEDCWREDY